MKALSRPLLLVIACSSIIANVLMLWSFRQGSQINTVSAERGPYPVKYDPILAEQEARFKTELMSNRMAISALKRYARAASYGYSCGTLDSDTLELLRQIAMEDESFHLALDTQCVREEIDLSTYRYFTTFFEIAIFQVNGADRGKVIERLESNILPAIHDESKLKLLQDFIRTGKASAHVVISADTLKQKDLPEDVVIGIARTLSVKADRDSLDTLKAQYAPLPKDNIVRQCLFYEHARIQFGGNRIAARNTADRYLSNGDVSLPEYREGLTILLEGAGN